MLSKTRHTPVGSPTREAAQAARRVQKAVSEAVTKWQVPRCVRRPSGPGR
jgi:hypothetical protein